VTDAAAAVADASAVADAEPSVVQVISGAIQERLPVPVSSTRSCPCDPWVSAGAPAGDLGPLLNALANQNSKPPGDLGPLC